LDDLGIRVQQKGDEQILLSDPVQAGTSGNVINKSSSLNFKQKGATSKSKWSDESSDRESSSDFSNSDSDDDNDEFKNANEESDDFVSVDNSDSDSDDFSDVEPWDLYQQNKLKESGVKRKKKPKSKKSNKKAKKSQIKVNPTKYNNYQAEFMSERAGEICEQMRDELLSNILILSEKLPPNTLDELIEELGGSENVAEMTGRKGRVISSENGTIVYESRTENDVPLEILNLTEKQRFMDGEKQIAIISEAASSGISLHSDRRAKNKKRRVHITIELPWSADRAIQQFGRTHRSNQTSAPEYVFLISDLAGEQRFASIVAKRLESLVCLLFYKFIVFIFVINSFFLFVVNFRVH